MKNPISRRHFMQTVGGIASGVLAAPSLFDFREALAKPQAPAITVRPNIKNASGTIVLIYAAAVKMMQALPENNPFSWSYQAAIHATRMGKIMPGWDTC